MTIDLIYATNSGGTREAALTIQEFLAPTGQKVSIRSARDVDPATVGEADLTILGSCTWERFEGKKRLDGQLQEHMLALVTELQKKNLPGKKFAIYALGDSSYTHFANAAVHLEECLQAIGATQVGPTLKIDGWFFNLDRNRKLLTDWVEGIVRKK